MRGKAMLFIVRPVAAAFALLTATTSLFASGLLEGQVLQVEGPAVHIQLTDTPPDWLRKGETVQAIGWDVSVQDITDKVLILRFEGDRASDASVGTTIPIRQIPPEQFSCG